jgi:hypothetical protein
MPQIARKKYDKEKTNGNIYDIFIAIMLFIALVVLVFYTYSPPNGHGEHYKGNCLLDFTTSYHVSGCLDD